MAFAEQVASNNVAGLTLYAQVKVLASMAGMFLKNRDNVEVFDGSLIR